MQPGPALPQEPQKQESELQGGNPVTAPPRKFNVKIIFLTLLILAVAGLGFWSVQVNINLKAAQQSLAVAQSRYDALIAGNAKLTADLGQTNTELEQANTELAKTNETLTTTKSEISKVNSQVLSLKSKKEKAQPYATLLFSVFFLPENDAKWPVIFFEILQLKDKELSDLFSNYIQTPTQINFEKWIGYAITAMGEILRK